MKPTLLRSKQINWPDSLVYITRNMLLDQLKQKYGEDAGIETLVENQQYLTWDGTNVGTTFDNYVFDDTDRDILSPINGENCLVTGICDRSTTSLNLDTIGNTATITVDAGRDFAEGDDIRVQSTANNSNFFTAVVNSYDSGTGTLDLRSIETGGAATGIHTDWELLVYKMRLFTYNGTSWDFTSNVKAPLYPSGLQAWTPLDFTIDLGKNHDINGFWNLYFKYPFAFLAGYPNPAIYVGQTLDNMTQVASVSSVNSEAGYEQQINLTNPVVGRYIRLVYEGSSNSVSLNIVPAAFAIIGTAKDGRRTQDRDFHPSPKATRKARLSFDEFLCVNSVRENTLSIIQDHYSVSKYHRLFAHDTSLFTGEECILDPSANTWTVTIGSADVYPDDKIGFNPARGAGSYDFDAEFSQMKANGIEPIPILARQIPYLNLDGSNQVHSWHIPYDEGGDPENPLDYKAWASFIFQFAARYGANSNIDDSLIIDKLFTGNSVQKGLNYIYAIGLNNESDKDWITDTELQTPKEMAAMISAAVDGHMGLMGPGYGARQADPNMKLMFNGLIESKTDYIKLVIKHLKEMRQDASKYGYPQNPLNDNFIIDVHQYPVYGIGQNSARGGAPVEETDFLENAERITHEIAYECPNAEVSITECGYDSTGYDPLGPPSTSRVATPLTPTETVDVNGLNHDSQAKHIMRLAMYAYIGGYHQAYLFTLKDPYFVGAGGYLTTFAMAGLYQKTGPNTKKIGWYAFNTFRSRLAGYTYKNHSIQGTYHFVRLLNGSNYAIVVWLGSNNDSSEVKSIYAQGLTTANKIEYADGVDIGNSTPLTISGGNVSVTVTEKPIIILLS